MEVACFPSEVMAAWLVKVWVIEVRVGLLVGKIWYVPIAVVVW